MAKSARLQKVLEMGEKLLEVREKNLAQLPTFGAQFDAMFREGVKDIRQTVMETYSGKGEHAPEVGAPGNPTQAMMTADLMDTGAYTRGKEASKDAEKINAKEGPELVM
jgi:hypothetical protein